MTTCEGSIQIDPSMGYLLKTTVAAIIENPYTLNRIPKYDNNVMLPTSFTCQDNNKQTSFKRMLYETDVRVSWNVVETLCKHLQYITYSSILCIWLMFGVSCT